MKKKQDPVVVALKELKWVHKVSRVAPGYLVTTKAGVLKTTITNKVEVHDGSVRVTGDIPKKQQPVVGLPAYEIELRLSSSSVRIRLVEKPKCLSGLVSPIPSQGSLQGEKYWDSWQWPCLGDYYMGEEGGDDWLDDEDEEDDDVPMRPSLATDTERALHMANTVAEYLQIARPDSSIGTGARSYFAYTHGLMPEEFLKVTKSTPEEIAERKRKEKERHARFVAMLSRY